MTIILTLIVVAAFALCLLTGSVEIPATEVVGTIFGMGAGNESWQYIVLQMRLPAALTALLTGAALGVSGLMLQSYFRNPLAGPSILGITSGANLAVGIVVLTAGSVGGMALVGSAMAGAALVLGVLLLMAQRVRHYVTLLIVGILLSYLTSSVLTLLQYEASAEGIQSLMIWGMGSFAQVGMRNMPLFAALIISALVASLWLIKPLNGWMMGELQARSLGISARAVRWGVLVVTGVLCAVTVAWCGPIAFVGLSTPHIARMMYKTDNHRQLMPASMLIGSGMALLCLWLSTWPDGGRALPINALTPLFGVPVILWVILKRKG